MRRYVGATGLVTKLAKPITEAVRGVGLAKTRHEKAEVGAGGSVDDFTKPAIFRPEIETAPARGVAPEPPTLEGFLPALEEARTGS